MRGYRLHAFGGPEALQLEDLPDPRPGPGEVLVRNPRGGAQLSRPAGLQGPVQPQPPAALDPAFRRRGRGGRGRAGVTRVKPGDRVAAAFMTGWLDGAVSEEKARTAPRRRGRRRAGRGAGLSPGRRWFLSPITCRTKRRPPCPVPRSRPGMP